jgi:hypothetical protein
MMEQGYLIGETSVLCQDTIYHQWLLQRYSSVRPEKSGKGNSVGF